MSSSNTMSSEESLSVRSISVDVETPEKETEQVMATVAELAKLRGERSAADGNGDCAPLSPPDVSLHSMPHGGGSGDDNDDDLDDPEVSTDATPVEENNKGSGTIPFESISKMSTTSSSGSEEEEEEEEEGRGEIGVG